MNAIVVGGGIAGIVSAILLRKKYSNVILIEKESELGGLYKSIETELGVSFDYGSHFLRETGINELDSILFENFSENEWQILGNLNGGGYFGGKLNEKSPYIDTRQLPEAIYNKGIAEMRELAHSKNSLSNYENVHQQLVGNYGEVLTEYLFKPILKDKYFRCELDQLSPNCQNLFGLNRVLAFTEEESRDLKKSKIYDELIAYHSSEEGVSNLNNFYPVKGGVSLWIELLLEKLDELNIRIITKASVEKVYADNKNIRSVKLNNNEKIPCSIVVWSIPTVFFLKATDVSFSSKPPKKLYTSIFNFIFNKSFNTKLHYIQVHEPAYKTFRVTLYPNIQKIKEGMYHLTAEVVSAEKPVISALYNEVVQELISMGVISHDAKILFQQGFEIPSGFVFPTSEFYDNCEAQIEVARENFNNILFVGRNKGRNFVAPHVLSDVYNTICENIL
jgi:protoporphyrinogen oxidase